MTKNSYDKFYSEQYARILNTVSKESKGTNKRKLLEYLKYLTEEEKTSEARKINLARRILDYERILNKPLTRATKEDAKKIVAWADSHDWTERSRMDFKAMYKQYRKWLTGNEDFPEDVRFIRRKVLHDPRKEKERTPDEYLRIEDFKRILSVCRTPRDKAIFAMIGELGLRPKELLMLKIRHIDTTNKEYLLVTVPADTKTGSRPVPLLFSKKFVLEWVLKYHPDRENPNAWLFTKLRRDTHEALGYKGLDFLWGQVYRDSKIKKRLTLYDFRKFSYTFKASKGWGDQQIKAYHGLKPKSKAIDSYVHIGGEDLIDPVLELYGVKVVKKKNKELEIINCPNCDSENLTMNKQCEICGIILDPKLANEKLQKAIDQNNNQAKEVEKLVMAALAKAIDSGNIKELLKKRKG